MIGMQHSKGKACLAPTQQQQIKQKGYTEAMRYFDNAKSALSKIGIEDEFYTDDRYVRKASDIAYSGVLVALDALAQIKEIPDPEKGKRKTIDFYMKILNGDQNLQRTLDTVYKTLCMSCYCDGNTYSLVVKSGFKYAKELINLINPQPGGAK